jgi:usherin
LDGSCLCKANVEGKHCDKCKLGYYNLSASNPYGCSACDCNEEATQHSTNDHSRLLCDETSGACLCKSEYVEGARCDRCMASMFNLTNGCMQPCNCDPYGSLGPYCNQSSGQCSCKPKISGIKCNKCELGFYNLTSFGCLSSCKCSQEGSLGSNCHTLSGQCDCKQGYAGRDCAECANGYWKNQHNNECMKCECNPIGVTRRGNICNEVLIINY